jgi:hypothetical protein
MERLYKSCIEPQIDKDKIYRRLHIAEGSEVRKYSELVFDELVEIIKNVMNLYSIYIESDKFELGNDELDSCESYVLCFISSSEKTGLIANEMMENGDYLKGFLINEMASEAIFEESNELNDRLRKELFKSGFRLTRRYAPGDNIDIKYQKTILDEIKKTVQVDAHVNEYCAVVPEKSLLYLFGLEELSPDDSMECKDINGCSDCTKKECGYRGYYEKI